MAIQSVTSTTKKTAIITGGSRGIGRNTAVQLAQRGANIIFTYHSNQAEAESVIGQIEALGRKAAAFRLDTGDLRAFDAFVSDVRKTLHGWGVDRFDYLLNNGGNSQHINFDQVTDADFDAVVNVHFKGVFFLTQKLLPLLNDGGRICEHTRCSVPSF
jgi:NAD(P)-dependent dehydrogenase (short-subunit alcohol dehydrogenase family)